MIIHVSTKSADYWACDTLGEVNLHQQWHTDTTLVYIMKLNTPRTPTREVKTVSLTRKIPLTVVRTKVRHLHQL